MRAAAKVRKPVGPARSPLPGARPCVRVCVIGRSPSLSPPPCQPPIESAVSQIRARVTDRYRGQESLARAHTAARRVQGPRARPPPEAFPLARHPFPAAHPALDSCASPRLATATLLHNAGLRNSRSRSLGEKPRSRFQRTLSPPGPRAPTAKFRGPVRSRNVQDY